MLQRFFSAVMSFLVLSSGTLAADPHILTRMSLDPSQSMVELRQEGGVLPNTARRAVVLDGYNAPDGRIFVAIALNGFSRNADLHDIIAWHGLFDAFHQPIAQISARLDHAAMLNVLSGPQTGFDLPVDIEINGQTHQMTATVAGQVRSGASIGLTTLRPLSFSLSDFGLPKAAADTQLHFSFVYETPAPETGPVLLARAPLKPSVKPDVNGLAGMERVLRPKVRPVKRAAPRVVIAAKPRKTAPAPQAVEKELVKITHTYREAPAIRRAKCHGNPSRVARGHAILDPTGGRDGSTRVDRAMRKLVQAFTPCRH